jgi:hypothetical protein
MGLALEHRREPSALGVTVWLMRKRALVPWSNASGLSSVVKSHARRLSPCV